MHFWIWYVFSIIVRWRSLALAELNIKIQRTEHVFSNALLHVIIFPYQCALAFMCSGRLNIKAQYIEGVVSNASLDVIFPKQCALAFTGQYIESTVSREFLDMIFFPIGARSRAFTGSGRFESQKPQNIEDVVSSASLHVIFFQSVRAGVYWLWPGWI